MTKMPAFWAGLHVVLFIMGCWEITKAIV